jgi:uncharacterized membrane protein YcjF (UPF0283 family)
MSVPERKEIVTKIVQTVITGLAILALLVIAIIVLYSSASGKIKTEYVKESEAAYFYERKFSDTEAALIKQHDINKELKEEKARKQKTIDSIQVVTIMQQERLKQLEKQNRNLIDSLAKRKYSKGSLSN